MPNIDDVIAYMDATAEDSWQMDVVRSKDGSRNCFFGHLFAMGGSDAAGNDLWMWFEEIYATTYMLYPVNDGTNPAYPQATAKQRVLAYLRDMRDDKVTTVLTGCACCGVRIVPDGGWGLCAEHEADLLTSTQ